MGMILFVDDEDMVIDVGKDMIERLGYDVLTAVSGREAIERYQENQDKIDLVILDMIMPGISGGDTYEKLKETNRDVKVILTSGYIMDSSVKEIMNRSCCGFIQKPFDLNQLSNKIREVLNKNRKQT